MDNNQNNPISLPQENPSSTLFISGLDAQMSDQDFANFFQNCPGVQGTRTKLDRKGNLIGFVDFDNEDNAIGVRTRFENGKFPQLTNNNYAIHFAKPSRVRADNLSRGPRNNNGGTNGSPNGGSNGGNNGGNNNNNNNGGNNNGGQRRNQGGFGDNNYSNNGNRGGRGQGGYNNYSSMPYGGPYSNMSGVGNAVLPPDASPTLYVEGVPNDATEREVSHIFRPFPGFQTVRTFQRESRKVSGTTYLLCFIEFDNPHLATNAMQMLQGYKFDLRNRDSTRGLRISYAVNSNKPRNNNGGGRREDGGNGEEQNDQFD